MMVSRLKSGLLTKMKIDCQIYIDLSNQNTGKSSQNPSFLCVLLNRM